MTRLEVQGDVALRPIENLPTQAKKIDKRPLALGEVSGHAHVIEATNDQYDLFEFDGKTFVATGSDGAALCHIKIATGQEADHYRIVLAPNMVYEVILQNEYNPEAEAFVRVLD